MEIRPLEDADSDAVLALNAESVHALSPMDAEDLARFRLLTPHAVVCELGGQVAAFSFAYPPGTPYESVNYRWHAERFEDFLYLDRIAVGSAYRRRGVASALYDALEATATPHGRMVCEIYSKPLNAESIAFHAHRGYRELGYLTQPDGKQAVMMEKPL